MAALVTTTEVREIMDNEDIPDSLVNACITAAAAQLDIVFANNLEISADLLKEIERWLSAHFVASTPNYRTASKEKIGDAEVTYTGKYGENLSSTPYGQMALQLDITGNLLKYGKFNATLRAVKSFDSNDKRY
jgi:hypothetical protein